MTERVDIMNQALTLLGEDPITSPADENARARVMSIHYEPCRDATLEAYEWSFAKRRFIPARSATPPAWGWQYRFELPSWCLRVIDVERDVRFSPGFYDQEVPRRNQAIHEQEGRFLLTDEEVLYCTGIESIKEEGRYSPLYRQALAANLAMMAALALTESNAKQERAATLFASLIAAAKTADSKQGSTRRLRSNRLIRSR